jgi:hypothetical protein
MLKYIVFLKKNIAFDYMQRCIAEFNKSES